MGGTILASRAGYTSFSTCLPPFIVWTSEVNHEITESPLLSAISLTKKESPMRRVGRATAWQYRWSLIVQRVRVPRVHCLTPPLIARATTTAA